MWLSRRWKDCAAEASPIAKRLKKNTPHGVLTAVFIWSALAMGIWCYALTKSTLEKTLAFFILWVKWRTFGRG